jgi:hypothetical protein
MQLGKEMTQIIFHFTVPNVFHYSVVYLNIFAFRESQTVAIWPNIIMYFL